MNAPGTQRIVGFYRNDPAIHYLDPSSGLNVVPDLNGNFITWVPLGLRSTQSRPHKRETLVTEPIVRIELTQDEVMVLFEWLHRLNEDPRIEFENQAEQRVAWDLEAALEDANPALFAGDYSTRLQAARERVRDVVE